MINRQRNVFLHWKNLKQKNSDIVTISATLEIFTNYAYYLSKGGVEVWLPKKYVKSLTFTSGIEVEITLEKGIAIQRGLYGRD